MKGTPFTPQQAALVHKHYANTPTAALAQQTGRSVASIYQYAFAHGLKKSTAFLASEASGRLNVLAQKGIDCRFKKGHTPANKGKPMLPAVYTKCQSTMYKQGQQPHNTASGNGVIRIRKDNAGHTYQFIRIALGKWLPLHQQIWLTANQPYNTTTHCLWFINGNSLDARLDNLQLITRAENARRNHAKYCALPTELQTTKKLINKLKTKITANAKHTI